MSQPKTVVVVGAGQMGRGIAQVAAQHGCRTFLADASLELAQAGRDRIAKSLAKLVSKEKISAEDESAILSRIEPVGSLADAASAELAVEAVPEIRALKKSIHQELDGLLGDAAIIASNTSSLSITQLAANVNRPDRFIGMHFMNPVPVMTLVEVIRGERTSDETYGAVAGLAEAFGKTVVTSQDYPGFIVNRILMPMINEAAFALMEGVATAADIDAAMKLGTNQPMGPLTLADFIGLDTCLSILEVLHQGLGDPKYRPCPLLRRLVDAGKLGRKSGAGFHRYDG